MLSVPHSLKSPCVPLVGEFLPQRLGTVEGDMCSGQEHGLWTYTPWIQILIPLLLVA